MDAHVFEARTQTYILVHGLKFSSSNEKPGQGVISKIFLILCEITIRQSSRSVRLKESMTLTVTSTVPLGTMNINRHRNSGLPQNQDSIAV